jgi:hypothetical protein
MPRVNNAEDIPTKGEKLIIVADLQGILHFRIFDFAGRMVVDTNETQMPDKARQTRGLKSRLYNTEWRYYGVADAVRSIVGHIPEREEYAALDVQLGDWIPGKVSELQDCVGDFCVWGIR